MAIFDNNGDVASVSKRPDHTPVEYILMSVEMRFLRTATALRQRLIQTEKSLRKTFMHAEKYNKQYMQWYPITEYCCRVEETF